MNLVDEKVMMIVACKYDDLSKHSKVFNSHTIEYYLWIYLDPDVVRNTYFLKAEELGVDPETDESGEPLYPDMFERISQCWIRVKTEHLNVGIGKHTFRLYFVDTLSDAAFSLYCSYYIQNDDPDKPYVYMKPVDTTPDSDSTVGG